MALRLVTSALISMCSQLMQVYPGMGPTEFARPSSSGGGSSLMRPSRLLSVDTVGHEQD